MRRLIAALALFLLPVGAYADTTGKDLLVWCQTSELQAVSYINGVYDMIGFLPKGDICPPKSVTGLSVTNTVCRWLGNNPKERHRSSAMATLMALHQTYPCP